MNKKSQNILKAVVQKRRRAIAALLMYLEKERRVHRWWVHPINQNRVRQGSWENLIQEMRQGDEELFFNYTRLTVTQFDILLSLVKDKLTKVNIFRTLIPPGGRLAITLRFLATGDSLPSLAYSFRIGKSTACKIIRETCNVLWEILCPQHLKLPSGQEWKNISEEYDNIWNLPHCLGSIDGKHIAMQAPAHSGSQYFNYKKHFSIVLFGICDAKYMFTYVDVGAYGSQSDGGVLRESSFGQKLFNNDLDIPADDNIGDTNIVMSYFFVGDEDFPLHPHLLRPYGGANLDREKRIYNYRISRARRCIENTFGFLVARFRVFHRTINADLQTVDAIVKAAVCLHNFIRFTKNLNNKYCPKDFVDRYDNNGTVIPGGWRSVVPQNLALRDIRQLRRRLGSRNASKTAEQYRSVLKDFVNSPEGAVPWQINII